MSRWNRHLSCAIITTSGKKDLHWWLWMASIDTKQYTHEIWKSLDHLRSAVNHCAAGGMPPPPPALQATGHFLHSATLFYVLSFLKRARRTKNPNFGDKSEARCRSSYISNDNVKQRKYFRLTLAPFMSRMTVTTYIPTYTELDMGFFRVCFSTVNWFTPCFASSFIQKEGLFVISNESIQVKPKREILPP